MSYLPLILLITVTVCIHLSESQNVYPVDDFMGVSRTFDGIGGLSGGSATSKLLIGYPKKQRDEILDYLFKPNFAASLQILKVEIGGDAQASDATEASHMHVPWEENYNRGYEWWLMKEAKKRNPEIKLYGLPWAFPGWLGHGSQNPYYDREELADYMYKWINGAKVYHNLSIDYIGIWNERWCDGEFVKVFRKKLDKEGLDQIKIIAGDLTFGITQYMLTDTELATAIDYVGGHYPGVLSPTLAKQLGKPLWSSEDYSTVNDDVGGGCWARILNQNYVYGLMTSTIAWNLIDSFYEGLPWDRTSLMTAREPWSGHYNVESPIWMSAHTTQFTKPGWTYLPHHHGVDKLAMGGTFVSLTNSELTHLTIVIEKMSHDHSICIRPALLPYVVLPENATFQLDGSFAGVTTLYGWKSTLRFGAGQTSSYFESLGPLPVVNGKISIMVSPDDIITLTTLNTGNRGEYSPIPDPTPFPLPFVEDFEKYPLSAEPFTLAPQQGSFDVVQVGGTYGKAMRQMVLEPPVAWCPETLYFNSSLNLLGRLNLTDVTVQVDIRVGPVNGSNGIFIGTRINDAGCTTYKALGIFFFIFPNDNLFLVTNDILGHSVITGGREKSAIVSDWNHLKLTVKGTTAEGYCNGVQLFNIQIPATPASGFVGVGTDVYGYADFDNLHIDQASSEHKSHPLYFVKESDDNTV